MVDLTLFEYGTIVPDTSARFQRGGCAGDPRRRFYVTLVALLGSD